MNGQDFLVQPIIELLAEYRKTQLRRIDTPLGQVTGMVTIETRGRELTGKIRCKNSMSSTTLKNGPIVSGIWKMEMEKGNSGEPNAQPDQD